MRGGLGVGVLGFGIWVAGVLTNWPLVQHLGVALLVIDCLCYVIAVTGMIGVRVNYTTDRLRYTSGEQAIECYRFSKQSWWPAVQLEIPDEDIFASLRGGQSTTMMHRCELAGRGPCELGGAVIMSRDPLGLFAIPAARIGPTPVVIYPRPVITPEAVQAASEIASSRHRRSQATVDGVLGDLRKYVPGDSPSRIHWRTTARTGTLMVAGPEPRRRSAVWLLVDLGGTEEEVDRSAGIAAYLAGELCKSGAQVGGLMAGDRLAIVPAGGGREQHGRLLDPLAMVQGSERSRTDLILGAAYRTSDLSSCLLVSAANNPEHCLRGLRRLCPNVQLVSSRIDS